MHYTIFSIQYTPYNYLLYTAGDETPAIGTLLRTSPDKNIFPRIHNTYDYDDLADWEYITSRQICGINGKKNLHVYLWYVRN